MEPAAGGKCHDCAHGAIVPVVGAVRKHVLHERKAAAGNDSIDGVLHRHFADRDHLTVQIGAGLVGVVELSQSGQIDDAGHRFAALPAGDLDSPDRNMVREVDGPVNGVDDKTVIRDLAIRVELFADNVKIRITLPDLPDQKLLDLPIQVRDQIAPVPLGMDRKLLMCELFGFFYDCF